MSIPEPRPSLGQRLVWSVRRWRVTLLVLADVLALALGYVVVTVVRYEGVPAPWGNAAVLAEVAVAVHVVLGFSLKLYLGRAKVGSSDETFLLGLVTLATAVVVSVINVLPEPQFAARSVPVGGGVLAFAVMVLVRAQWRRFVALGHSQMGSDARPTLVVGAGEAGHQLVRSMQMSARSPFRPVGLLDDDPWKRRLRLDGVPVLGTTADLERVLEKSQAEVVVVAIPSASGEMLREISDRARAMAVEVKVLPPVEELFGGSVSITDIRDINVEDVLGRSAIETDIASIADFLNGKRVLVTGAGGSIGSELARQIAKWHPADLMMLDRDESALHAVQLTIHGHALLDSDEMIVCDIRDAAALRQVFDERRPEVVFHAAALKHLPLLERYPAEALKTNVLGTANVLEAATRAGVERFVNVSTDKAADPTSILGFSKRAAERITADYARAHPGTYLSVRFGNVLGSRGSVLTTFAAQIAKGGPVTVTHPDVTRYFMTVSEAVQLVLQAGAIGRDGEVLILDMGEPVRIAEVAEQLIAQSGQQIEIVYTGLREGEKMDEILRSDTEDDDRPFHDLISHVRVEPLSRCEVPPGVATDADHTKAVSLMREWSHAPTR